MAEERKLIVKIIKKVSDYIGHKPTVNDNDYKALDELLSDEQAEIVLAMKKRVPMFLPEIAKRCKKDEATTQKLLDELCTYGMIEYNWENPEREKQYVLPMYVPGCAEFLNMNKDVVKEHPVVTDFFYDMSRLPLEKVTPMVPPGGAGIGMHVIPVEKAIETEQESVDVEHISYWLKKYEGKYAASPCSCRASRKVRGENTGDDPDGWCIAVGDMADYVVETNKGGRYITYDEAMEIFRQAEANGYVHQITNIDGADKIFAICNCNPSVCYALRTSQLFNTPNMSRSAYIAEVDEEKCVACGGCVENCPAGAVKLGQKLCTKDGKIEYPRQELPDEVKWSKEKWNENYRDDNRINCYETGTAPCKTNCPAHISVQGYLKLASQGKYDEALALIKKENPFPAVCGRICNRRCEDACTRATIDRAVAIDEVKKFIAELELKAEHRYIPPMVRPSLNELTQKIAIIGAGPSGLSCAYYLAEMGYKPVVFEKEEKLGGMLTYGIPSFKLEKDVIEAEIDVLRAMGVEFRTGVEVGKDVTINELRKQGFDAFYVAIGCQGSRMAGVKNEDASGVYSAIDFLKTVITNENTKLEGKTVVIGGGNVAIDVARCSVRCGAETEIYCLEQRDKMPASIEEINEAIEDGVNIECGYGLKDILVKDGKVTGVVLKKCTAVFDANGKFNPTYDESNTKLINCQNVVLSIGQCVSASELFNGENIATNKNGTIICDKLTYQTSVSDIFAGGDCYTGPKFAIDAIASGKQAAISLHRFVQEGSSLTIGRNRREFIELNKDNLDIPNDSYDNTERQIPNLDKMIDAKKSFRDNRQTFTEEQVKKETSRCLGCGASIVDPNRCLGCGVCTTKCKFDAIHLSRKLPEASTMVKAEDKLKAILPYAFKRQIKIKKAEKAKKKGN